MTIEDDTQEILGASTPIRGSKTSILQQDCASFDDGRCSVTPNKELSAGAKVPQLPSRTIPGCCSPQNRDSLSWGQSGCLAYGCGNLVVVVETASVQYLQILIKHRSAVTKTVWSGADDRQLTLASADTSGRILIWDVVKGDCVRQFQDGNLPITDIRWMDGRIEKSSHLLLCVHPPNHLILWNALTGLKVWKRSYDDPILGLDLDPFSCSRLMFLSQHCVLFVNDFHPEKCPRSAGQKFYIVGGKGGSPGRTSSTDLTSLSEDKSTKGAKLSKIMRQMVLGETRQTHTLQESVSECLSANFHRGVKNLILLAFNKEVLLVDVSLSQALGTINLERIHSSLAAISTCREKSDIYVLHESGSISVWRKKSNLSVLATPSMSRSTSMIGLGRTPQSTSLLQTSSFDLAGSDVLLEVSYLSKVQSDHVRMGKNCKVLGLAVNPMSERQISFLTSDGRVYMLDYLESKVLDEPTSLWKTASQELVSESPSPCGKILIRSILGSSSSMLSVVRMCPALTLKNLAEYVPLLAAGSVSGNILIFNISTGSLQREMAVHTGAVHQIEWISNNPSQSCLSCSHHPVTGSSHVRNELIYVNILTGKTRPIRTDRGEEPKLTMIRVSHAKQYFVLAFASGPFELWDAVQLCLLRSMPKKFPLVTALVWVPNHKSKKKNVSDATESWRPEDGPLPKEHMLFTDTDSQLYNFSVEGHSIRDGTRIPAETGIGTINAIASKAELIVRGDSDGNINIWNMKARQPKNIHTGRGYIKELLFAPGRGNMKVVVLYKDGLSIWDVKELELINELRCPRDLPDIVCVDWAASDRVVVLCRDGSIRLMGLALASACSSVFEYPRDHPISCISVLPMKLLSKLAFNSTFPSVKVDVLAESEYVVDQPEYKIIQSFQQTHAYTNLSFVERNIMLAHVFGFQFEKRIWQLIYNRQVLGRLSESYDIFCDRDSFLEREDEKSKLHLNRATDRVSRGKVTARLLCLGQIEPVVKLLLETEPAEPTFLSDQLLACLISTTSSQVDGNHLSTTKMVATKLIAEGQLWEGVQLLCLVGKVWDACTYLRASKHWEESMWLGKCRLKDEEYKEISKKYSDYLVSQDRIQEAALLHASVDNLDACLEVLHLGQYRSLAVRLLHHMSGPAEPVLAEAVLLEAARFLFEVKHLVGANMFADKVGDKGVQLKQEFHHLK